jgi:hypothetical protein
VENERSDRGVGEEDGARVETVPAMVRPGGLEVLDDEDKTSDMNDFAFGSTEE